MRISNYISNQDHWKIKYLSIPIFLILIYLFESMGIITIGDLQIKYYQINPFICMLFALYLWLFPRARLKGKIKYEQTVCIWALNVGIISVLIQFAAGIMDGMGKSPYDHSIIGILRNIFSIVVMLVGRETARSLLVNGYRKKISYIKFLSVSILMTIISIPFRYFLDIDSILGGVIFISRTLGPMLALNLLATYFASSGGAIASIIYIGVQEAFQWLSPILPDLKWITAGFIGILTPLFSYLIIQYMYGIKSKKNVKHEEEKEKPFGWIVTSIVSVGIIWFSIGVFPIFPSVIATGSMEPMIYPGDVILIERVGVDSIKTNDVIQFQRGNILISHRVIDIGEDENGPYYITKGDNNSAPDLEKVKVDKIKGKVVFVIPKIGWPTLILKQDKNINLNEVVY